MAAPALSYEQWLALQAQQHAQYAPGTAAPPPGQSLAPAATPATAPPPQYIPGSTYSPYVVPAEPIYQTAPATQPMPTNFGFGAPTQDQRNASIQSVAPPTSFGYGPDPGGYIAADQRDAYLRGAAIDAEQQQLQAQVAQQGGMAPPPTALTAEATRGVDRRIAANQMPWQEKVIPGIVRDSYPAKAGGAVKDALGSAKDALGSVGPIAALGGGLEQAATGILKAASIPAQRVNEVQITRRYDELTSGDPDKTFGAYLPSTMLTSAVLNPARQFAEDLPGDYEALQNWLNDPANATLVTTLFEQGYNGETGYGAVYQYYNEQQGMGGLTADVLGDPFLYAGVGGGVGKAVTTRLGTLPGAVGKAGRVAGAGLEVADAAIIDPLKLPGLAVKGVDRVAPGLRVGERLATGKETVSNALLSEAGRRGKELNQVEESAGMLERAAAPTSIPEPWLFERDAAGRIRLQTGGGGWVTRPLVRDLDTGVIRPVQPGDMTRALEIAARLPHQRTGTSSYRTMMDDWMGAAMGRASGLPREVDFRFPSRGVGYRRAVDLTAERIKRQGQPVVDGLYQDMRTAARTDPVKAAQIADRVQAAMEIAGHTDASAKLRKSEITRVRAAARKTGKYRKTDTYAARMASNAKAPPGATPSRLTYADVVDVLDDETARFASGTLSDRRVIGDVVLQISQDARRLQDLATQARNGTLGAWDQAELDRLLKSYGHEFGTLLSKDPALLLKSIADWNDAARQGFVAGQARRTVGIDKGWINKSTGLMERTGIQASDSLLGKVARGLDKVSSTYRKYQLYNPLNILRYSGLQAIGNAVTLAVGDFGALEDYAKAIAYRGKNLGQKNLNSPVDNMMQSAGLGRSPFLKQGIKDDLSRADFGDGPVESLLKAGRRFAGAFDLSLREAAYMHRFQPRYRALQLGMREEAIRRAASMGVPVSPARLDAAFAALDNLGNPYRAWDAAQLKTALTDAARDTPMGGMATAVENWADRVARDYANGLRTLHKDAISNVNRLGFTFNETKLDAALGWAFMYSYWSSRANMLYTREMLGNPALLNGYVSLWKTLDREGQKDGSPPWLRGFYQFMQTPMGLTVFANPTALMNTFAIFNPDVLGEGYMGNLTGVGQARKRSPFMVNPAIDTLLFAAGLYGSGASTPNILPVSLAKLYDWINHWNANAENPAFTDADGNPVPVPYPARSLGTRALTQFIAENVSPKTKELFDRIGIPADVMQFGDEAASQSQDIRMLMRDILREQNPTLDDNALNQLLVDEHAGGFDTADPVYQQALDRYTERAYAGILDGRDVPNVVRGLIDAASPFQRQALVTSRIENDAILDGYYQANEDQGTYQDILAAQIAEPIRIGGFGVAPPSLFTEVELGGTVITPEQLATMGDAERAEVAEAWFTQRNPDYDPTAEIPFPDAAWRTQQIARAADPEDLALQEADDQLWNAGTPEQNAARATADGIKKGQLPEGTESVTVTIDGQAHTFDAADLANMTEAERGDLKWLWLQETGAAEDYEGYWAAHDALIAENPDLGGHQAMKELAEAYPGGAVAWVTQAVKDNPTTYGQYAERLDPVRYPVGSEDWAKKMLSLEAYQTLTEERSASNSPLAWEDAPGAPVIPGLTGAANLNDLYVQQQAEIDTSAEEYKNRGDFVTEDLQRLALVQETVNQWDADNGLPVGETWGKIVDQMANGYQKGVNGIDYDLKLLLDEEYPRTGPEGETWSAIPGPDSQTGEYVTWALRQAGDARDPQLWARESLLKEEFAKAAEQGLTTDATGATVLAEPEATAAYPDILAGYGMTRSADGSGEFLSTQTAPAETPQAWRVGNLGATLYAADSTSSQPLIALDPGMDLAVIEDGPDWTLVETPYGMTGYVRKRYMSSGASTPAPVSTPVEDTRDNAWRLKSASGAEPVEMAGGDKAVVGQTLGAATAGKTSDEVKLAPYVGPEHGVDPRMMTTDHTGQEIIALATQYEGVAYEHNFPSATDDPWKTGWDCSSFIHWLADNAGISEKQYPNDAGYVGGGVPVGSHFQWQWAEANDLVVGTSWQDAQPGDAIYFDTDPNGELCDPANWNGCMNNAADHVGLYLGPDPATGRPRMMHAAAPGVGTVYDYLDTYPYPTLGVVRWLPA